MATALSGTNEKYAFCLSYLNTKKCSRGGYCRYEHANASDVAITVKPSGPSDFVLGHYRRPRKQRTERAPCRFYLRGHCRYGTGCRFLHQNPVTETTRKVPNEISNHYGNSSQPSTSTSESEASGLNETFKRERQKLQTLVTDSLSVNNSESCELTKTRKNRDNENWVYAPEFFPKNNLKTKSYAEVLNAGIQISAEEKQLCVFFEKDGICKYPPNRCPYIHGNICDMCGTAALHPYNEEQRKKHRRECVAQHEKDMELSFAIARSKNKSCGVCFEVIMEKSESEQRFGILPNCNHCFCLVCIRKWRKARQFDNRIIRACPECRVTSDFVCPSLYWVETKEEKDKLINNYKKALSEKDCKYFRKGNGSCPFGNKCFYLHALPDGTKADVGPPRRRRVQNVSFSMLQQIILWDFLDERENHWLYSLADDLEDLVAFFTDSDDSDWSDSDVFLE